MSECIAMAIGVVLGAACVIVTSRVMSFASEVKPSPTAAQPPLPKGEAFEGDEQLKKQWENILNYNGTGNGQIPIGDE